MPRWLSGLDYILDLLGCRIDSQSRQYFFAHFSIFSHFPTFDWLIHYNIAAYSVLLHYDIATYSVYVLFYRVQSWRNRSHCVLKTFTNILFPSLSVSVFLDFQFLTCSVIEQSLYRVAFWQLSIKNMMMMMMMSLPDICTAAERTVTSLPMI